MTSEGPEVEPPPAADETPLQWKERGNLHYSNSEYEQAAKAYQKGLDLLLQDKDSGGEDDPPTSISLRANLALVLVKLEKYQQAEQECTQILQVDPENAKGESKRDDFFLGCSDFFLNFFAPIYS